MGFTADQVSPDPEAVPPSTEDGGQIFFDPGGLARGKDVAVHRAGRHDQRHTRTRRARHRGEAELDFVAGLLIKRAGAERDPDVEELFLVDIGIPSNALPEGSGRAARPMVQPLPTVAPCAPLVGGRPSLRSR